MRPATRSRETIVLRGVRQNNLRGFDLELPLGAFTIVTGVSGSGKSSLAFDTLYAEGQRRYVASFSSYTRQFLERLPAPDVESVSGLPPAVALRAVRPARSARSTVGTLTETLDHLQLLYARAGTLVCDGCGREVSQRSSTSIARDLLAAHAGERLVITFSVAVPEDLPNDIVIGGLLRAGFVRVLLEDQEWRLDEPPQPSFSGRELQVVVDRLKVASASLSRLVEALETAFERGRGRAQAHLDGRSLELLPGLVCACGRAYPEPSPGNLSFNNPLGACPTCKGFGRIIIIDRQKVVPDPGKTLLDHAIKPLASPRFTSDHRSMIDWCRKRGIPVTIPWGELSEAHKDALWRGGRGFYGLQALFEWLESKSYKMHVRIQLARYRGYETCPTCHGARLKPEALRYRIGGLTLPQLCALPISDTRQHLTAASSSILEAARPVLERATSRLGYLEEVGLGYLSLDRPSRTLSGGEAQRVHLTAALGASLVSTLFVLDEPSAGLHARDSARLVAVLHKLKEAGNTVLVVEHDPEIIAAADYIVDLGPGAGEEGGELLYAGPPSLLPRARRSVTARTLAGLDRAPIPPVRRHPRAGACIRVAGAREHNLQNLDVEFPLALLTAVTGVSGSGKSTLVDNILYAHLAEKFGEPQDERGACDAVTWQGHLNGVVRVDQGPPGRSSRSNPATYVGAWDGVRSLFGAQAKRAGLDSGARLFSFNVPGGRCEICKGEGSELIDMQFLADVRLTCTACGGRQFSDRVLQITWRGRSIHDVLQMTVSEALDLFGEERAIRYPLEALVRVGLGYLRLGQPTTTLSGGEAQRLKLARHLAEPARGPHLFILDEPTVGLHLKDVARLAQALHELVDAGHTVVVVEHHLDLIASADHVIDLGPEGGPAGGYVIAQGPPETIANCPQSVTGRYLKELLDRDRKRAPGESAAASGATPHLTRRQGRVGRAIGSST
ncbi:MAG: excinuclease ABC subunit UvrA [Planctomycetota bacterium]